MLGFFKKDKTKPLVNNCQQTDVQLDDFIRFSVYGIGIDHPNTWTVFVNPSKPFLFNDGRVKIDRSFDRRQIELEITSSLRWAKPTTKIGLDDYVSEIENQFKLKQKKNKSDRFAILSIDACDKLQCPSYVIKSKITANHSIYRTRKAVSFISNEIIAYDDKFNRLIFGSFTAREDLFEGLKELNDRILFSLSC